MFMKNCGVMPSCMDNNRSAKSSVVAIVPIIYQSANETTASTTTTNAIGRIEKLANRDSVWSLRSIESQQRHLQAVFSLSKRIFAHAKLCVAIGLPLLAIAILCIRSFLDDRESLLEFIGMEVEVAGEYLNGKLVNSLQKERGMSCVFLSSNGPAQRDSIWPTVLSLRNQSDSALANVTTWRGTIADGPGFESKESFAKLLSDYRQTVGVNVTTCQQNLNFYTNTTNALINIMTRGFLSTVDGQFWSSVNGYSSLLAAKDLYGIARALGGSFFASGGFRKDTLVQFAGVLYYANCAWLYVSTMYYIQIFVSLEISPLEHKPLRKHIETLGAASKIIDLVLGRSHNALNAYNAALNESHLISDEVNSFIQEIVANNISSANSANGVEWFNNMTVYIDLLSSVENRLITDMMAYLEQSSSTAQSSLTKTIIIVAAIGLLCPPIMIWYAVNHQRMMKVIQRYMNEVSSKTEELNREKKRTELILNQLLPPAIVMDLKNNRKVVPETYESVTIFFSDVKGFTTLSSKSTPFQIVNLLGELYTKYDNILDRYDVYKVETIGDAYMVVSGLPRRNGNRHSSEICTVSLDILMTMEEFYVPHMPSQKLLIRIGVHTGPCAAGVVGIKMPRFCLFGDTVNTASRMESTGEPCRIQISQATKISLDQHEAMFETVPRGHIEVKGKGQLATYWLLGKKRFPWKVDLVKAETMVQEFQYWKL